MILETVDVMQLDGGCEVFRNQREGSRDHLAVESCRHFAEDHVDIAADQLLVRLLEPRDVDQLAAAVRFLADVAQHAAQDAVEPRPGLLCITQIAERQPGLHAGILHRVLGVAGGRRPSLCEAKEAVHVRQHERRESGVLLVERERGGCHCVGDGAGMGRYSLGSVRVVPVLDHRDAAEE